MVGRLQASLLCCGFILALHLQFGFSADFQDCKKFDIIPEGNYDRNESSANDGNKRPLGFVKEAVTYPGTTSDVRKPCVFLTNLTSKYVEVLIQPDPGSKLCFKDDKNPPNRACSTGGTISSCFAAHAETVKFEFYCDTGEGCDSDAGFWYRLRISAEGVDTDDWCRERQVEFPQNLIQAPPDAVGKPTEGSPTDTGHTIGASILMVLSAFILTSGL